MNLIYFKRGFICFGVILVIVGIIDLVFGRIKSLTTFNVNAKTELFQYIASGKTDVRIPLDNVEVTFFNDTAKVSTVFRGEIALNKGTLVKIQRISNGAFFLELERGKNPIGTVYNSKADLEILEQLKKKIELEQNLNPDSFLLENGVINTFPNDISQIDYLGFIISNPKEYIEQGRNIVIPIEGYVTLGRSMFYETIEGSTALLTGGSVRLISKSNFFGEYFESGNYEFKLGDMFIVKSSPIENELEGDNISYGFASVDVNGGLNAVYNTLGVEGHIVTVGPKQIANSFTVSSSWVLSMVNDPIYRFLLWIIGILGLLATTITLINEFYVLDQNSTVIKKKEKGKKDKK